MLLLRHDQRHAGLPPVLRLSLQQLFELLGIDRLAQPLLVLGDIIVFVLTYEVLRYLVPMVTTLDPLSQADDLSALVREQVGQAQQGQAVLGRHDELHLDHGDEEIGRGLAHGRNEFEETQDLGGHSMVKAQRPEGPDEEDKETLKAREAPVLRELALFLDEKGETLGKEVKVHEIQAEFHHTRSDVKNKEIGRQGGHCIR